MRFLLAIVFLLGPSWAIAACSGKDLRTELSQADRAWIRAKVADIPFAKGNHWTASKTGRVIHVVGTMHYNDQRMKQIAARLAPIVATADVLLMEASLADKAAFEAGLGQRPGLTFITEGPTLIDRMSASEWNALVKLTQRHGLPSWMVAKMRPWFLAVSMSVPPCLKRRPNLALGLDQRLGTGATDAGTPMKSLEDPWTVIEAMNAEPLEEQLRQMRASMAFLGGDEDGFHTMAESYFDEEVVEFLALSELKYLRSKTLPVSELQALWNTSLEQLLVQRNEAWIPVIEATRGDSLVVAVGALHLPGESGVLARLQKRGYLLERSAF